MEEREPIYKSVADVEISTDSRRMYHVVSRILRHLKKLSLPLVPAPAESLAVPAGKTSGTEPLKKPETSPSDSTE
jgi:hypothetical protein